MFAVIGSMVAYAFCGTKGSNPVLVRCGILGVPAYRGLLSLTTLYSTAPKRMKPSRTTSMTSTSRSSRLSPRHSKRRNRARKSVWLRGRSSLRTTWAFHLLCSTRAIWAFSEIVMGSVFSLFAMPSWNHSCWLFSYHSGWSVQATLTGGIFLFKISRKKIWRGMLICFCWIMIGKWLVALSMDLC